MLRPFLCASFAGVLVVACGGSTVTTTSSGAGGKPAASSSSSAASTGATTTTTASSSSGAGGAGGAGAGAGGGVGAGGARAANVKFQTYVTLGDSISAEPGYGQAPFYWALLQKNDDTMYPDWHGKDLTTLNGGVAPTFVGGAIGGSVAGPYPGSAAGTPTLDAQVASLPATLAGPVLVTITIGGNDMVGSFVDILQGTDQGDRMDFQQYIDTAMSALTMPGRFGAGVDVYVFQADIYDPSDGTGDFAAQGCPFPFSLIPEESTTTFFANWNDVVHTEVAKYPNAFWAPMHDTFKGHGLSKTGTASWFNWSGFDCLHPNAKGHNAIREMFWNMITG
jgi:lysophospholipase L1-like esterase